MKTIISSVILGLFFISCSRDSDEVVNKNSKDSKIIEKQEKKEEQVLVTKILHNTKIYNRTFTYSYDGDRLKEVVDNQGNRTIYQYKGDLIASSTKSSAYETYNVIYTYDPNGRLGKSTSTKKINADQVTQTITTIKDYIYKEGGIIEVKVSKITETDPVLVPGSIKSRKEEYEINTYTYVNGVITKLVLGNNTFARDIKMFEYDTKNSPLMNIRGISALAIDYFDEGELVGGLKNNVKRFNVKEQRAGKIKKEYHKDVEYEYTSHNYPAKIILKGENNDVEETFVLTYNK